MTFFNFILCLIGVMFGAIITFAPNPPDFHTVFNVWLVYMALIGALDLGCYIGMLMGDD